MTTPASGGAATATRTGSSTPRATCDGARRASTTCPFGLRNGASSARGPRMNAARSSRCSSGCWQALAPSGIGAAARSAAHPTVPGSAHYGPMHQRAAITSRSIAGAARRWAWLAGVASGVLGLAVANLGAWLVGPAGSPVSAVGELVIDLLPAALVNFGKDTLGTADKPVLLAIITVAVLLVSALAGQAEYHRRRAGAAVFAGIAVLGLVGISARPGATIRDAVPTVVGMLAGYLLLRTLTDRLQGWQGARAQGDDEEVSAGRRRFLVWTGVAGGLAVVGAVAGQALVTA